MRESQHVEKYVKNSVNSFETSEKIEKTAKQEKKVVKN